MNLCTRCDGSLLPDETLVHLNTMTCIIRLQDTVDALKSLLAAHAVHWEASVAPYERPADFA